MKKNLFKIALITLFIVGVAMWSICGKYENYGKEVLMEKAGLPGSLILFGVGVALALILFVEFKKKES